MSSKISTVAFSGIDSQEVEVQVQILNGLPSFSIVGLPAKSVAESRERIRASLFAIGLALPSRRIIVNLSPADLLKDGSHFDLPITIALLCAMDIISQDSINEYIAIGELSLDGAIKKVSGVLLASIFAKSVQKGLICPKSSLNEAMWGGYNSIIATTDLLELINHLNGKQIIDTNEMLSVCDDVYDESLCFSQVRGQKMAKRALEIAAAGGHNILMSGPPGVGKSLLSERVTTILPPLNAEESLEVTMIYSLLNQLPSSGLITKRPYRAPHHSASLPAIVGGGSNALPGEISLAHRGVLFLDELPEFSRRALEALRQPLETGKINVARVNNHVTYPAKIQLIAAMNPCKCGMLGAIKKECKRAPICGKEYMQRISGPLLDRFDMFIRVDNVNVNSFLETEDCEKSSDIRKRVFNARELQFERYKDHDGVYTNSEVNGKFVEKFIQNDAKNLLYKCVEKYDISARGFHKILKVARTIADLDEKEAISQGHISEAIIYRNESY